jgi:hypothetical protein
MAEPYAVHQELVITTSNLLHFLKIRAFLNIIYRKKHLVTNILIKLYSVRHPTKCT